MGSALLPCQPQHREQRGSHHLDGVLIQHRLVRAGSAPHHLALPATQPSSKAETMSWKGDSLQGALLLDKSPCFCATKDLQPRAGDSAGQDPAFPDSRGMETKMRCSGFRSLV